jgi:glycosyltransferase involved in cell wall biosynthesis
MVLFFDSSLITLLTCLEAKRRNIRAGAFLNHGNNRGQEWCRDVDFMLTDSAATARMYKNREGYKMNAIGKFVNPSEFRVATRNPRNMLFINPIPAKGAVLVVQLALWLTKNRPDIQVEVVDTKNTWQTLASQVASAIHAPLADLAKVKISANTSNMSAIYESARILLAPSLWWESGPRVIIEAMINGIPSITSNAGGIPEILGGSGCIIEIPEEYRKAPYSRIFPEAIIMSYAEVICQCYDDEDFYNKLSSKALEVYERDHNITLNGNQLYNLLVDEVANKHDAFYDVGQDEGGAQ